MKEKTFSYTFKIGDVFTNSANYLVVKSFMGGDFIALAYCDKNGDFKSHPRGNEGVYYSVKTLISEWRKVN